MIDRDSMARTVALGGLLLAALGGSACKEDKPAVVIQQAPKAETKYGLTAEQAAQTLVKVGDVTITVGEFAERLGGQSPYLRARYNSPERRREVLDNMVRFELLALEAKKRGFDKSDEVARTRKQMMVQQMMQDLFDRDGLKLSDITDAEIEAYYNANQAEFDKPAQVRASHILFKDRAAAEKILKQLQAKPDDMDLFRKLAQQHNQDPLTKDSYGDLHFFSEVKDKGETDEAVRPEPVRKALFTLKKVGELYPELVQSELGFHVLKLTARREPMKRSLEDARRLIQNRLWREKREAAIEKFVADLRSKADVKENPELLAKVQIKREDANDSARAAPMQGAALDDDEALQSGKPKPKKAQ